MLESMYLAAGIYNASKTLWNSMVLLACFIIVFAIEHMILFSFQKISKEIINFQTNEVKFMQKYKHIIDNSEEGLIIITPENKVDYFNETFFRFFKP